MKKITLIFAAILGFFAGNSQVPSIDWTYNTGAPAFGSSACADLDKDGKLEIVFSTYTNDGRVHCLNAEDGSVAWIYDISGCGDVAPLIYDLDGDDTLDVLVNGSCNPTIFSINGYTGKLNWSTPSGGGDSPPTVYDIDQDQKPEVLFGNFSGQVRILNGENGSLSKQFQVDNGAIQTAPSLADVNFDGKMDFIVANYFNDDGYHVYAIDFATGNYHWQYDDTSSSNFHAYHAGAIADLDRDDTLEYVIGRNNGSIVALNIEDGSELWKVTGLTNVFSALAVADVDNDSVPEVIYSNNDYVNFNDHIGVLSGLNGSLEWSYPVTFSAFRGVAIADMNGNGIPDFVSGHFQSKVRCVEPNSGLLWEIDLKNYLPSGLPYSEADHGPVIADFDNDGKMEAFTVAGYGTYTPDSQNTGTAFMLEWGSGSCPEWLMFRQDVQRSGYLSPQDWDESCDTATVSISPISQKEQISIYPNPGSGKIFVESTETINSFRLFDLSGKQLISRSGSPAKKMQLQVEGFQPGIYLLEIIGSSGSMVRKILIE